MVARDKDDRFFSFVGVILLIVLAIPGTIMFIKGVTSDPQHVDTKQTEWRNVIERAVDVPELENDDITFITVRRFFSSTTIEETGVSAPQVLTDSPEQFAQLVPGSERVYVENEIIEDNRTDTCSNNKMDSTYTVERRYYAFIENRNGVMLYVDSYQEPCFEPVTVDENGIAWQEITHNSLDAMRFWGFILMVVPVALAAWIIYWYFFGYKSARYDRRRYKK